MKCIKVSIWCLFTIVLMTSTAMGGIDDLRVTINGEFTHLGDITVSRWSILNNGNSSMYNLSVYFFGTAGLYTNQRFLYINEIKPMEKIKGEFYAKAVLLGWNWWSMLIEYDGKYTDAISESFEIEEPPEQESVPEFPTVALPAIAIMGLIFLLQRRKAE